MNATFAKKFCWGILFGALLLTAGAPTASQAAEAGDFKGTWVANGTRKPFAFSADRKIYTFEISGHVNLQTGLGKVKNYWSTCVGLSDSETGSIARCVWKDLDGPEVYITLKSDQLQTNSRVFGSIVGGTEHLAGISGDLSFVWSAVTFLEEAGVESVTGQTLDLSGTYRVP
jgi:hypothetical protein